MKLKVFFETSDNLENEKYRQRRIGGDYPTEFYPSPIWNTELLVLIFNFKEIKEIFNKEKHIHNKLYRLMFITDIKDRIIFMPSKFKHWMDCATAQEYLINLSEEVKE